MIDFNGKSTKLFWKLKLLCCLRRTQLLLHKSIWEISWVWKLKKFVFAKLLFSIVEILNMLIWLTKTCACSNFCVAAIVCWTHVNVYFFYTFGNPILSNGYRSFNIICHFSINRWINNEDYHRVLQHGKKCRNKISKKYT